MLQEKTLKSAFFVSKNLVLLNSGSTCFLIDIATRETVSQFSAKYLDISSAVLSPNCKKMVLGSWGTNAFLWDLENNEIRELGLISISAVALAWKHDSKPILSGSRGGVFTVDLTEFLNHSAEDLKHMHGWDPGHAGIMYNHGQLYQEDMMGEIQVDSLTSDIWIDGETPIIMEIIEGDAFNQYTLTNKFAHEIKGQDLGYLDYPNLLICTEKIIIKNQDELIVCDLISTELIKRIKLDTKDTRIVCDFDKHRFFTYSHNKLEQWDLTTGQKQLKWSGAGVKNISIIGNKCLLCKDYNSVEIINLNSGKTLSTFEIIAKGNNVSVKQTQPRSNNELITIKRMLESGDKKELTTAFNILKNLPEDGYSEIFLLIYKFPLECLKYGIAKTHFEKLATLELKKFELSKIPQEIFKLNKLNHLSLYFNNLTNLPAEIGQLKNLQVLDFSFNQLRSLPAEIGHLVALKELNLFCNVLEYLPAEISQLQSIKKFILNTNKLKQLPVGIGSMSKLQTLDLKSNKLSLIPSEIGKLSNLKHLLLENNHISELPDEIGELKQLEELDLYDNKLSNLNPQIGRLKKLKKLSLHNNSLSNLPLEIGNLTSLETLDLTDNSLKILPTEICQLSNLKYLWLDGNKLKKLPVDILNLSNLQLLSLGGNPISKAEKKIIKSNTAKATRIDYSR